jgi:bacteriocin-like protein
MIPTEIIPVTELTDTELDAVSGGLLNNLNIAPQLNITLPNVTSQINIGVPTGVAVGLGTAASILQNLGQGNVG